METAVYALCALTAIACAVLLAQSFARTRARLLFWAALCFTGLALNNILLFVDKVIAPDVDLSVWRTLPAFLGVTALVYGLIWEADRR